VNQTQKLPNLYRLLKDNEARGSIAVGLLTPYTGGNLGDAAIQEAAIRNVRKFWPNAQIYGLTLSPDNTESRHGIPCYPIMGFSPSHYAASSVRSRSGGCAEGKAKASAKIRNMLREMPLVYRILAGTYKPFRAIAAGICLILVEVRHIVNSYKRARTLDLLIASGGGQLDDCWGGPWGHPYALFKWGLLARISGKPYVFLSVGTCTLNSVLSALFIRGALKLSVYRSFRDQISKDLLSKWKFTRNDPVFPDLAFSFSAPQKESRRKSLNAEEQVVGLSPIAYLRPRLWPKPDASVHGLYVKQLRLFILSIVEQGYKVMLFPTAKPDEVVIKDLAEALPGEGGINIGGQVVTPPVSGLDDLFLCLKKVDCVIASRLHGVILSHLAGKPVLAISYDRKVDTYMGQMNQSEFCLNIQMIDAASLEEKLHRLQANSEQLKVAIGKMVSQFHASLDWQYRQVFSLIEEIGPDGRKQKRL